MPWTCDVCHGWRKMDQGNHPKDKPCSCDGGIHAYYSDEEREANYAAQRADPDFGRGRREFEQMQRERLGK